MMMHDLMYDGWMQLAEEKKKKKEKRKRIKDDDGENRSGS